MRRVLALLVEASAAAKAQWVPSMLTIIVVMGAVTAVMLTTGRAVGAEQNVLGTIDSAGTRSIVIRAEDGAGVTSDVISRVEAIDGVSIVLGLSAAVDSTNTLVPDGLRVPVRFAYGSDLQELGIPALRPLADQGAYASAQALKQLGMLDAAGSIDLTTRASYSVIGSLVVPEYLSELEPLVLIPEKAGAAPQPVGVIVAIAAEPGLITPVSEAVRSVIAPADPTKITLETSESLAELRGLIQGQLGTFSRSLVGAMLVGTSALTTVVLFGLVMLRRRDFGRRRALGATRSLIVTLLLLQTLVLSLCGVLGGSAISLASLVLSGDPLPGIEFFLAVAVLVVSASLIGSFAPAVLASTREPIREMRVP